MGEEDYHAGPPGRRFEATFEVQNNGPKAVKAIAFDYVFYGPDGRTELKRLAQRLGVRVEAGQAIKLRKKYVGRLRGEKYKVEVKRVEYADGAVWQAR